MANELTITGSISFSKSGTTASVSKTGITVDITGSNVLDITQTIGTSEEALVLGDVATPGYCIIENLDATNFVEIRPATGVADCIKVRAGKFAGPFEFAAAAPYAIADTAPVKIRMLLIEQ